MNNKRQGKKIWTYYFTKKVIVSLGVVATLLTIVGGIWAFENHYATNQRVDKVEMKSTEDVKELEIQIAGALENQQRKSDVRYWQFMYDKITNDIFELKRQMRRYPEDKILQQDYADALERRKEIKKKLDDALQEIKIN